LDYTGYKSIINFYDIVRVETNLKKSDLPDEIIDFSTKAPMAEEYIKEKVTNWSELDSSFLDKFNSAVIYKTCLLCIQIAKNRNVKSKQLPTIKIEYNISVDNLENYIQENLNITLRELGVEMVDSFSMFSITQ